jgi:hypothetical protein
MQEEPKIPSVSGRIWTNCLGGYFVVVLAAWLVLGVASGDVNFAAQIAFVFGGVIFLFVVLPVLAIAPGGAAVLGRLRSGIARR